MSNNVRQLSSTDNQRKMPQDDRTTSSDPRVSRSQRRSSQEQEAKRRAAPSSSRSMQPGAQSSTDVSVEADLESRNNKHRGHRDDRERDRDRESRRHRTGSHDRDDRDERDRQSKRRAAGSGRGSTKVGATSVSDGSKDERRKRREDDDRRSKQRARRPDSTSGASAVAPGASHGRSPTRSAGRSPTRNRDAVERKLAAAGLGMNDNKKENGKDSEKDKMAKNSPDLGGGAYAAAPAAANAPEAASVDDDGAIQIQAVLVNDDKEQPSSAKDEMAQENERLRREMTAENERLRQQMQEDQNKLREEVQQSNREEAEAKAKKKKQRNICILIVVLLLIGAGVGAFFGTQGGDESTASSLAATTTPAPTTVAPATPTEAPIAPEVTAAPTEVPPLHEAPSDEHCTNIANADPVDGQDDAEVYGFDTTLEMTLAGALTSPDAALPVLQEQMQSRLMTDIAGCTPEQSSGQRRLRVANKTGVERQLQANKYVILNAQIASMEVLEGESCKNDAAAGCSKVLAKMNMYLQGEEKPFVLMNRLIKLLNGGDDEDFDLARSLGLPNGVRSLALESIIPDTPTLAPTPKPSELPSASPSTAPTTKTTPAPTPAPTPVPTPGATTKPPQSPPTPMPTPEPTTECTDKCNGDRACEGFDVEFFDVGCGSCNGEKSCLNAAADIGDKSCKDGACEGFDGGGVGESSCIGRGACKDLVDVTIGDVSCKCEGCCACIAESDTLPDGSCNAIAESEEDVEYRPYQTTQRVEFCCQAANSGTGDGDEDFDEDGGPDGGGGGGGGGGARPPED